MKQFLIALLFIFLSTPVFAGSKVTLHIIYNDVNATQAEAIVSDAIARHEKACKNKVTVEKVATTGAYWATNCIDTLSTTGLVLIPN